MWDLILGSQDHTLSRRQMLNHWATMCPPGFGFKSRLSDISMGPPAFFWYPLAWYMIFHPLTFNLLVSIGLRWASFRQRTDGCCFLIIILFMIVRERERQKIRQREKQAPHQEPNMGLDPRLQDYTLNQRQRLNSWATQASWILFLKPLWYPISFDWSI